MINNNYKYPYPNFKAHKIAHAKSSINGVTANFEIYRLQKRDRAFLRKLLETISIRTLMPNISSQAAETWQNILQNGIFNAMSPLNRSFLAISENKPCGIITYRKGQTTNLIDLCSIPIETNKKALLCGKTMILHFLQDIQKSHSKNIKLEAVKSSHGNPAALYESLGFETIDIGNRYIEMACSRDNINKQATKLKKNIQITKCKPEKTDLNNIVS